MGACLLFLPLPGIFSSKSKAIAQVEIHELDMKDPYQPNHYMGMS